MKVFIAGINGFKGAYLAKFLELTGYEVMGVGLPSFYNDMLAKKFRLDYLEIDLSTKDGFLAAQDYIGDVDVMVNFAASALVSESWRKPFEHYNNNVSSMVHFLRLAAFAKPTKLVIATTDKVYAPPHPTTGHSETDLLGGTCPYSKSKVVVERIVQDFWDLNLLPKSVLIARMGNVYGVGDCSDNRLFSDITRAITSGKPLEIRNKHAVRPWTHVMDAVRFYSALIAIDKGKYEGFQIFNYAGDTESDITVGQIVDEAARYFPDMKINFPNSDLFREVPYLKLDVNKALDELNCKPAYAGLDGWIHEFAFLKSLLASGWSEHLLQERLCAIVPS